MSLGYVDVFADKEEDLRVAEQTRRNMAMREKLSKRAKTSLSTTEDIFKAEPGFVGIDVIDPANETTRPVNLAPWHNRTKPMHFENAFLAYHEELIQLSKWLSFTPDEERARLDFLARIRTTLSSLWPEAYLVVFGSSFTELALPSSDIDVAVMNLPQGQSTGECLRILADRLLETEQVSFVEIRDKARIPLLVLKDKIQPSIEVDITINTENPLGTSRFIMDQAINRYPQFKPLVLFLKCFILQRSLHDTYFGGVGSYLLSCMVLAFLQQHRTLQDGLSLGHLLFDFFSFYGREFNSSRDGLSVVGRGEKFNKFDTTFDSTGPRRVALADALCIESPLETNLDIGNKCFQWKVVKQAFLQGRLDMMYNVQNFEERTSASLIAPGLLNGSFDIFRRIGSHDKKKRKRPDSQD